MCARDKIYCRLSVQAFLNVKMVTVLEMEGARLAKERSQRSRSGAPQLVPDRPQGLY